LSLWTALSTTSTPFNLFSITANTFEVLTIYCRQKCGYLTAVRLSSDEVALLPEEEEEEEEDGHTLNTTVTSSLRQPVHSAAWP